jgi:apolipoprotein D and lipocalin family protein
MPTVDSVDLDRFMGDWYVIAAIPTWLERDAYGAIERYERVGQSRIATTFTFRKGGFDGPAKRYTPTGFVREGTGNAVWGMRFVWPFRAEYRIIHLGDDYGVTVIGRTARDYAWIMAREPWLPVGVLERLSGMLEELGYDVSKLRVVPQLPG